MVNRLNHWKIIIRVVIAVSILIYLGFKLPWTELRMLLMQSEPVRLLIACLLLGVAVGLALIPFQRLPFFLHQLWQKIPRCDIIESLVAGFRQHGRSRRLTCEAMAFGLAICLILFTIGHCIALASHLDVTYMQILTILAVVICVISLPISIGGHGIREGMFVIMFSVFGIITINKQTGVRQEPAVLSSILFFALFSVRSLVGGLVYLTLTPILLK